MKKIVYIMNVDWNWIKQRPHFLAEGLSKKYDVTVVYQYRYNRKSLQRRDDILHLHPLFTIPRISRYERTIWINELIMSVCVRHLVRSIKPDCLFLTYPTQISMIPPSYNGEVIYDCMDNYCEFLKDKTRRAAIEKMEKELVYRSNIVFASSDYLADKIKKRTAVNDESFFTVRNAFDGNIIDVGEDNKENCLESPTFKMAYVGTISEWFDWTTIEEVLRKLPNCELHLFGPVYDTTIPAIKGLYYHGIIEHSLIYSSVNRMDAMVMPFKINEIVKAVDPVKIYEYINYNKEIIICKYDEVERYKKYVFFYSNTDEFVDAITAIRVGNTKKYSLEERKHFLLDNSWDVRIKEILNAMEWSTNED